MKHAMSLLSLVLWIDIAFAAEKPNIIFILADDLGYGDVGCYGQKLVPTPNIDRLAAEGIRFSDFYSGSTVCAPSRCSLMTGLHTGHAVIRGNGSTPLRPEDVTVAEILKQAGYTTGLVGKWGLGEPDTTGIPNRQGFDYFFGYLNQVHAHNYYTTYLWRNQEKVPLPDNENGRKTQYTHDLFTQEAIKFIEANKARPFFLYLAYTIPHANNERRSATGNGMEVPDFGPYKNKNWTEPEKGHAAMIDRMDGDVGRIMKQLSTLAIDKNTLMFFTSDNGPHKEGGYKPEFFNCSGPLRGTKRDLYEGGIRVPMVARWPAHIKAGTVSRQPLAFWDVLPTLADLAQVKAPAKLDGISFLPTLLDKEQKPHDYLYWEFHEKGFAHAVRRGNYKAVRKRFGKTELYDLKEDLGEKKNIADEHPDVTARMEAIMESAHTPSKEWPMKKPNADRKQ